MTDEEMAVVGVVKEYTAEFTRHEADLLDACGNVVKSVTFDYLEQKDGGIVLGNYTGLVDPSSYPLMNRPHKRKEAFLTFNTEMWSLETTERYEESYTTDYIGTKDKMRRSDALERVRKNDNAIILEEK